MGQAAARKRAGDYPEYKKIPSVFEKRQVGLQRNIFNDYLDPIVKTFEIGHGQQIARRDGRI